MAELTPQQVDVILYNLRQWRRLISLMEPRTSTSVVTLPVAATRSASSGVEQVAVRRAAVTQVLDIAEDALRELPPAQRRIARMKYEERMSLRDIAYELTRRKRKAARRRGKDVEPISKSWVGDQVDFARELCARRLASVRQEFWDEIWTLELRNSGQRG